MSDYGFGGDPFAGVAGIGEYFSAGAVNWEALAEKRKRLLPYYPLDEVFGNWRASEADRDRAARDYEADYWRFLRESAAGDPETAARIEETAKRYGQ
jgi:hypothetical protein